MKYTRYYQALVTINIGFNSYWSVKTVGNVILVYWQRRGQFEVQD